MNDEIRADHLQNGDTYEDGVGSDPVTIAEVHMHGDTVVVTGTEGEQMTLDRDEVVWLVQSGPVDVGDDDQNVEGVHVAEYLQATERAHPDVPAEPAEKVAAVTITATEAWETWKVRVPIDADEDWVRENFHDLEDKWLDESGLEGTQSITEIEFEPNLDDTALTTRPPF